MGNCIKILFSSSYKYYKHQKNINMLNLVGKNLKSLTEKQIGKATNIKHIDVSNNQLFNGLQFKPLVNLITLIIDDNKFSSLTTFPPLQFLQTLSANKNNFTDFQLFLQQTITKFPKLKNLSTLKNPINPFFQGQDKYTIFRDNLLDKLPDLQTFDGCAISIIRKQKNKKLKAEEGKYEKLEGVAIYDEKYATNQLKTVKTKSVGHRYIRNNQL